MGLVAYQLVILLFSFAVAEAIRQFGTREKALNFLLAQPNQTTTDAANANTSTQAGTVSGLEGGSASSLEDSGGLDALGTAEESNGCPPSNQKEVDRDVEMENALTLGLESADAFSDYDIDVAKEGEAITEYLALVNPL